MRLQHALSRPIRLGWISSWNTKCGIAEYSKLLLQRFDGQQFDLTILASRNDVLLGPDESRVIRCWANSDGEITSLLNVIQQKHFEALVIQFSFAFQCLEHLEAIIALCNVVGTHVVLVCHAIHGPWSDGEVISLTRIAKSLQSVDCILVHSQNDVKELNAAGLNNVEMFPHGYPDAPQLDQKAARALNHLPQDAIIVGSYGFLLPHKGVEKLVEAIGQLRYRGCAIKLLLVNALYPNTVSAELLAKIKQLIEFFRLADDVVLKTEYLPNDVSLGLLAACDVLVFPYQNTVESSSAAVRMGLASGRPVLCSPLSIFSDVASIVTMLPGREARDICSGLESFLSDTQSRSELARRQADWIGRYAWPAVARLLQEKLDALLTNKNKPPISDWLAEHLVGLQRRNEYLARLKQVQRINKSLRQAHHAARQAHRAARDELQLMCQSRSWRLTWPLRHIRTSLETIRMAGPSLLSGAIRRLRRTSVPAVEDKFSMTGLSQREQIILQELLRGVNAARSE